MTTTQHNPVLLVHGINDTGAVFNKMAFYLRQRGLSVHTLDLFPNNGVEVLDKLGQQVADYIDNTFESEQPLNLVGFSMGGIVSRYYIQRLGGIKRVQRFITISSPHKGTIVAYGSWLPGCLQMRPHSLFLEDLNSDVQMLKQLNFTSIWTPYDLMILPATSSQLGIGKEIVLPVILHPLMLTNTQVLAIVLERLTEPMKL
ncbi:triacylglycerol lipase [Anabaena sp. UHCC 0204]|uniref:esterase/lipase family protein n=1 Tax=Anabaena sp. UHCC 0204 TaxID=2590009 RepID=UPI0014483A2D|nr:triacylglycerol lipase [Anabaena sp. UHCC 0204]MTJ06627.1 triacylglycerol lipase [Anabaena sp. UHCC 0204]